MKAYEMNAKRTKDEATFTKDERAFVRLLELTVTESDVRKFHATMDTARHHGHVKSARPFSSLARFHGLQKALVTAVNMGAVDLAEAAIEYGASLDEPAPGDPFANTPIHIAMGRNHTECLRLLVARGARLHTPNVEGYRPLDVAVATGMTECVTILLDAKADVNLHPLNADGFSPLHFAVTRLERKGAKSPDDKRVDRQVKANQVVRALLQHGANVNATAVRCCARARDRTRARDRARPRHGRHASDRGAHVPAWRAGDRPHLARARGVGGADRGVAHAHRCKGRRRRHLSARAERAALRSLPRLHRASARARHGAQGVAEARGHGDRPPAHLVPVAGARVLRRYSARRRVRGRRL